MLDLKYAYSQFHYFSKASNQCNSNIVGGEITSSYHFKTGFYGLGDMPDNFQFIMDTLVGKVENAHCYLEDILLSTVRTACDHSKIVSKEFKTLDDEGLSIKWAKCKFLTKKIERLGFKTNNLGTKPLTHEADAIKNLTEPRCVN